MRSKLGAALTAAAMLILTSCETNEVTAITEHFGLNVTTSQATEIATYYTAQPNEGAQVIAELARPCDMECTIRRAWPDASEDRAVRIAKCESKLNPTAANRSSSARGLFQIMISVHRARIARLGYTPAEVATEPLPNIAVALDIYHDSGFSPWVCKG